MAFQLGVPRSVDHCHKYLGADIPNNGPISITIRKYIKYIAAGGEQTRESGHHKSSSGVSATFSCCFVKRESVSLLIQR